MTSKLHVAGGRYLVVAIIAALVVALRAEGPRVYAIRGARIVPVAGPVLESGTIVLRNGLIEAVGAGVSAPPEATLVEGAGLTVYPGLIDLGAAGGLDVPQLPAPRDARTREDLERWKRQVLLRPQLDAAQCVKPDGVELRKLAVAGITTALAVPGGGAIAGHSSLLRTAVPDDAPQIGNVATSRQAEFVVRTPVFLHVRFLERTPGDGYPESLMGVIAFVRQAFLDAGAQAAERARSGRGPRETGTSVLDPALAAMEPALAGRVPVAFEAQDAHEIRRVLSFSREFKLDPVIEGGLEADQTIDVLKAQKARVLLTLNYPTRSRMLPPDADESVQTLRARAHAPAVAAALEKAGVPFGFHSGGLKEPGDFLKNAGRAVRAGLPADAAIRSLTLGAAVIAGVGDRLGSIEKGKVANLLVVQGDLFDEKATIKHVFVEGRPLAIDAPVPVRSGRGGSQ
jgi:imidazolonepropionase-like amidohydrolase